MHHFKSLFVMTAVWGLVSCNTVKHTTASTIQTDTIEPTVSTPSVDNNTALSEVLASLAVSEEIYVPKASDFTEEEIRDNPFRLCAHAYAYGQMVPPPPPLNGTERAYPIVLMTRAEFNEKIKRSPLWDSLHDKELQYGSYGHSYYFSTLFKQIGIASRIYLISELDGQFWKENQRITKINYGRFYSYKRSLYKHQLLPQERKEMIETITLVIDDRAKATDIVDTLYEQYMDKVNHQQYLSDGQTIHTHLEYDGKYFSLQGKHVTGYDEPVCNYDSLQGLIIN